MEPLKNLEFSRLVRFREIISKSKEEWKIRDLTIWNPLLTAMTKNVYNVYNFA